MLLGFVLVLSLVSVLEIRSATAMTKFHGFQQKQMVFLGVGLVGMFVMSLVDYHRLLEISYWAYGVEHCVAAGGDGGGDEGAGGAALDQSGRRGALSAVGVGEAGADLVAARFFWDVVAKGAI